MPTLEAQQSSKSEGDELIKLAADIGADGAFGHQTFVVTAEEIRVCESSGAVTFSMPIAEIQTARNEPLIGGGRLEVTTRTGQIIPIVTYTQSMAEKFSEAARGIEQLAKGEPLLINLNTKRTRCAKCNRLLPEKDGVCPACIHRGRVMLRIGTYLLPYKNRAVFLVLLSIATTALNLIPPQLQGRMIDTVLSPHHDLHKLYQIMGLWLGVVVLGAAAQIFTGRTVAFLAAHIAADLRSHVYRAIEFLQLSYFDKKQVGAITSRVTQDTDRVWGFLINGVPYFVINGLLMVGIFVFLFRTNARLALCIISPIPLVICIALYFWRPMSTMFHRVGQKWARVHIHLNESLSGIRVVKAFAQEDHEHRRFQGRNNELSLAGYSADSRWMTIFGFITMLVGLGQLINWTVGGAMVVHRELSLGQFVMINSYLMLLFGPLQWFAQVNDWFSRAMAGAERIFEVIDTEREKYAETDDKTKAPIRGEVEFDNVRFGYDKSNPVLKELTFKAMPGEMIGFVGKSGAGKSTTINLISRFYEPDSGTVKVDGTDYRELGLQEMRRQIGVVLQEPFLFGGTIAENIAYGKPGASLDEIITAAKAANAHNFILGKPDGYDTMVGERGAKLSGGERQRISIARAILHDPRILILDEATSSVDVETEKQIQEALGRLTAGRTTFAIAHRLSTLRNADRLIVLDKGKIVEMGTHAELMEKKGEFFKLVETQSAVTQIIGLA